MRFELYERKQENHTRDVNPMGASWRRRVPPFARSSPLPAWQLHRLRAAKLYFMLVRWLFFFGPTLRLSSRRRLFC